MNALLFHFCPSTSVWTPSSNWTSIDKPALSRFLWSSKDLSCHLLDVCSICSKVNATSENHRLLPSVYVVLHVDVWLIRRCIPWKVAALVDKSSLVSCTIMAVTHAMHHFHGSWLLNNSSLTFAHRVSKFCCGSLSQVIHTVSNQDKTVTLCTAWAIKTVFSYAEHYIVCS